MEVSKTKTIFTIFFCNLPVFLGFVCEFGGEGRGGLWRERNREKIRKIFYIF
jgi:hypothetical protein